MDPSASSLSDAACLAKSHLRWPSVPGSGHNEALTHVDPVNFRVRSAGRLDKPPLSYPVGSYSFRTDAFVVGVSRPTPVWLSPLISRFCRLSSAQACLKIPLKIVYESYSFLIRPSNPPSLVPQTHPHSFVPCRRWRRHHSITMLHSTYHRLMGQASSTLYAWTPMIMLICYGMLSFFFYLLIPPGLHRAIWYSLVALQTFTALSVSTEAMQSIRPSVNARKAFRHAKTHGFKLEDGQDWPHIDVVLVAYLPNEQEIIMRQVKYALRELNYPKNKITINVCYNTPYPIEPVETELRELERERTNVRIVKVPNSTSKAENINHFLTMESKGEIITLYDTDHYPEPDALRWVAKRFMQGGVDIIQGRCCIYNYGETTLTKLIASEFDLIYGVMHSGRAEVQGYGFFGGSNGHWNASLLRTLGMQKHMLTEDIDSSMRAIISGARIEYDLKVLSYELAPETLGALVKQRLRWAQGWTQVAFRHAIPSIRRGAYSDNNGWRSRTGLFQLLLYREIYFYINSQLTFLLASGICYNIPTQGLKRYFEDFGGYALSMFALAVNLICLALTVCIQARNRSHFTNVGGILLFAAFTPIWYSVTSLMAIFCHFREFIKFEKWNPTARTSKNGSSRGTSKTNSQVTT